MSALEIKKRGHDGLLRFCGMSDDGNHGVCCHHNGKWVGRRSATHRAYIHGMPTSWLCSHCSRSWRRMWDELLM